MPSPNLVSRLEVRDAFNQMYGRTMAGKRALLALTWDTEAKQWRVRCRSGSGAYVKDYILYYAQAHMPYDLRHVLGIVETALNEKGIELTPDWGEDMLVPGERYR